MKISWLGDVEDHDFGAALAYLTMRLDQRRAQLAVEALRDAPLQHRRANDILRATGHKPLPGDDPGVRRDFAKVGKGKALSPVLVVSFELGGDIADGYHRVSVAYLNDPFAVVPLRLAHVPGLERPAP